MIVVLSSLAMLILLYFNQQAMAPLPSPTIIPTIEVPAGIKPAIVDLPENVTAPENSTVTPSPTATINAGGSSRHIEAPPAPTPTPAPPTPTPAGMASWGPASPMPPMQAWSPMPRASPLTWGSTLF
ncbi:hypothetical protein [Methanocella conradii]|uniref:hypothetical protein n=1 Tax=Methanocella conradii TaxID=1175444 RepID=UPI00117BF643|nr:hypothetical protein [Methanocella conradii]MDI6897847.1 hypothetical protein [Methanocella conradii]